MSEAIISYTNKTNLSFKSFQNLRRAFELQSTQKWNTFRQEYKTEFLKRANNNMDMAKDIAFFTFLNMAENKESDIRSKS